MNPPSTTPNRWRPITVFNLLVGLLFSLSALGQPAFLKEGLVAYYPFNGNANDESGNENNPSSLSGTFVDSRINEKMAAISFNGVNQKASFPKSPLPSLQQSTMSLWVKINKIRQASVILQVGNDDGVSNIQGIGIGIGDNRQTWAVGDKLFIMISGVDVIYTQYRFISNENWIMLTVSVNNNTITAYADGSKIFSKVVPNIKIPTLMHFGSCGPLLFFDGSIDNVRIYDRSLSDGEVKALYDYESAPQPLNPRIASVTAQIVNGFVVGATITDGGYGYVSNPVVTIIGGGGTGAKATATQFNGVVTSITITNPGIGYTSAPTITIAPPPFPPRKATSTAQIINGFVVGTKITDGGFGYDSPPAVLIVGGGGSGATAVATVANGVVTAITISNPGIGYTSAPLVRIASPPFAPKLAIETSKVYVRMSVVLGRKYQLEASTDLNSWTTTGPAFIAQDEELAQEFDVNQVGRYFRINQVP